MNDQGNELLSLEEIGTLIQEGPFEETLAALQAVVEHLEHGRLSMDESITWYEAGLGLMRRCSLLLNTAELRISTLNAEYLTPPESDTSHDVEESLSRGAQLRFTEP